MFTNISWGSYLIFTTLLSAAWYSYILIRYYRPEIKKITSNAPKKSTDSHPNGISANFFIEEKSEITPAGSFNEWEDMAYNNVEHLMQRIKETIFNAGRHPFNKEEFSGYLTLVLKEFSFLKNSPHRGAINEFIESECELKELPFSQEDADLLWG